MLGEDTDETVDGSFNSASVFGRICVVAAGPLFNFLLAFLLSLIIVGVVGYDAPRITGVEEGSPAYEAGLREGDLLTSFDGYHIDVGRDLYVYTTLNELQENKPIRLEVKRDGEKLYFSYLPEVRSRYLLGFYRTDASSMVVESLIPGLAMEDAGVKPGDRITAVGGVEIADGAAYDAYLAEHPLTGEPLEIQYEHLGMTYVKEIIPTEERTPLMGFSYNLYSEKVAPLRVVKGAGLEVKYMIRTTILSLKSLFTGKVGVENLSGPVGVVNAIGETYEESRSAGLVAVVINLLGMAVLLSANLGVMNLLPIPALDGGRLVFLLLEAIRRKPINRNIEGGIHFTGLLLLMALMFFVMYHDILRLF